MSKKRWIIIIITIVIILWWSILYYLYQHKELKDWCPKWFNETCDNGECICIEDSCSKEDIRCKVKSFPWYKNKFIAEPQKNKKYTCPPEHENVCEQLNINYDPDCKLWECLN